MNYATLNPGQYRFLVRVGEDTLSPAASLEFTILPPVWATSWFRAVLALLAGLIAYALHRYRVRHILALELVRTRIAADLHDDIGASLSQIAILSEVARKRLNGVGGLVVEPLEEIAAISAEVVDSMSDMVWAIEPQTRSAQRSHLSCPARLWRYARLARHRIGVSHSRGRSAA